MIMDKSVSENLAKFKERWGTKDNKNWKRGEREKLKAGFNASAGVKRGKGWDWLSLQA
jgi:hypothetical protein